MAVTELREVVEPTWGERMGSSFKGIVIGLALFVGGFPLLFWNEGRAVATAKSLEEGRGCVVELSDPMVDPDNEGKLVYVSGKAVTGDVLSDPVFGISFNGIRLQRRTEIYQWVEHSKTRRIERNGKKYDETTYTYSKKWSSEPVDSSEFKESGHDNPPVHWQGDETFQAEDVMIGDFRLPPASISRIGGAQKMRLGPDFKVPESLPGAQVAGDVIYLPVQNQYAPAARQVAAMPELGDQRVTFRQVPQHGVSIVARQMGDSFADWISSNKRAVNLQSDGIVSVDELFADAESSNALKTWLFRLLGFVVMFIGIKMILGPLTTLVDKIPGINWLVGSLASLTAFVIAAVSALVTIAVAWIFYRPIVAGILLGAAALLVACFVSRRKAAKAKAKE